MTLNLKNLLNPKVKISKMGEFQELRSIEGLELSAISADLYGDGRDDLALFYFKEGANFAAIYTASNVTSASINWNVKIKRSIMPLLRKEVGESYLLKTFLMPFKVEEKLALIVYFIL